MGAALRDSGCEGQVTEVMRSSEGESSLAADTPGLSNVTNYYEPRPNTLGICPLPCVTRLSMSYVTHIISINGKKTYTYLSLALRCSVL